MLDDQIRNQYEKKDNYRIQDIGNGNKCYIFFSSNGLYGSNDLGTFEEVIIKKDRYEWKNVGRSQEIVASAGKIIFVRDIYQQFYIHGINRKINTIDKLCTLLKEVSKGMNVITCGTSSGGYMAVIVGIYLQAECIFSFGGQWVLNEKIIKGCDKEKNAIKYCNITQLLIDNNVPIMYFYSALNAGDVEQVNKLSSCRKKNIYCFAMKSDCHGYLMFNNCYRKLLTCDISKLIKICNKYKKGEKIISLNKMCFILLGKKEAFYSVIRNIF